MLALLEPRSAVRPSIAGLLALAWTLPAAAAGQSAPRILHEGLGCIVAGRHAVIEAQVEPSGELETVKVYFRAEIYPAFFYVEASPAGDGYQAVLPRAMPDVSGIVYYLEAVDRAFSSYRTEEFRPRVVQEESDCEEDETRPAYLEGPAAITVGATTGGSSVPPGFLSEGIVGTILAAGRAAGNSTAVIVGVGAAAGAAVGVGVVVSGGNDLLTTTTIPLGGGVSTTAAATTSLQPTTSAPAGGGSVTACFDTSPNPPSIPVGETVRFDASCSQPRDQIASYVWDFNDGRDGRDGRVVTRQYTTPGVFPAVLEVRTADGTAARVEKEVRVNESTAGPAPSPGPGPTTTVPGRADLQVTGLNSPNPRRNANANYTVRYSNAGPDPDPSVTLVVSFNAAGAGGAPTAVSVGGCGTSGGAHSLTVSCSIGALASRAAGSRVLTIRFPSSDTYSITATIFGGASDPNPGNDSRTVSSRVTLTDGHAVETSFLSELLSERSTRVQASVEINGLATLAAPGGGPIRHALTPQPGTNTVSLYAFGSDLEGVLWKVDFSRTEDFVAGSISVDSGEIVSSSPQDATFRLSGSETRIRFRFRVEP